MYTYLLDPKAPLVLGSGRPFGSAMGADTLPFPLPSTVAGALRTAYGEANGLDYVECRDELLDIPVAGPLAVRRPLTGGTVQLLFPKPADALYLGGRLRRLGPKNLEADQGCDLPHPALLPVFLEPLARGDGTDKAKPDRGPALWYGCTLDDWLRDGRNLDRPIRELGVEAFPVETRTHVGINPGTYGSDPGRLFQSAGVDLGPQRRDGDGNRGWEDHSHLLLARFGKKLPPVLRRLGGEGRLVHIQADEVWPVPPAGLSDAIAKTGGLRLILATPALFAGGWKPGWLNGNLVGSPPELPGLRLRLRATALDRWQPVSGWDLTPARQDNKSPTGKPRAVRRLVPAGAVYWFEIVDGAELASKLWLTPVSDDAQDRRDGFGLALPGIWKPIRSND